MKWIIEAESIDDIVLGRYVIDLDPLTECKECKNWVEGYITDQDDFIPPKCGKYQQMVGHSSNDFCSLAERRTDE